MRVTRGIKARRRRKKVLKRASGYYGANSRCYTVAKEKNDRALVYAYRDRKNKKRSFRRLWIQRINAAVREHDLNYSSFMFQLKKAKSGLDRKTLSELALDQKAFSSLVKQVQSQ